MHAGEIKMLLGALALPPAGPLLLAALGAVLAAGRRRRLGLALLAAALGLLWLLSCHAVALRLVRVMLPEVRTVQPADVRQAQAQAVVVLGGGVLPAAREYGQAQPDAATLARLRYGIWLGRAARLPVGFSGGVGWSGLGVAGASEAEVAQRTAAVEFGAPLRWTEGRSRDTAENAAHMRALMGREGIVRIALVTDALHLPRAQAEFERAGFTVLGAPTGLPTAQERPLLEWLPSTRGLSLSRQVLREFLALALSRLR